jgi:exopolyphosphatase/guanosine-5'-triphosphate,3'-diphosphate pyrophosphatase
MKHAIIDLGTNTFKIIVIEEDENNKLHILYKTKMPIGFSDAANTGRISVADFIRGVNALKAFKTNIIDYYNVNHTIALATAGLRSTDNGKEFVEYVQQELGMRIEIISGEKEAEYIYEGIKMAVPLTEENVLMLDIGGGSAEFIIGNKDSIQWCGSFKLGAGRMTEKLKPSDPIKPEEVKKFNDYYAHELKEFIEIAKTYQIKTIIGSSGSFNTFGRVAASQFSSAEKYKAKLYFDISAEQFKSIHHMITTTNLAYRSKQEGIKLIRSEIIVAASLLVNYVMEELNIQKITQSQFSLIEGVISSIKN